MSSHSKLNLWLVRLFYYFSFWKLDEWGKLFEFQTDLYSSSHARIPVNITTKNNQRVMWIPKGHFLLPKKINFKHLLLHSFSGFHCFLFTKFVDKLVKLKLTNGYFSLIVNELTTILTAPYQFIASTYQFVYLVSEDATILLSTLNKDAKV